MVRRSTAGQLSARRSEKPTPGDHLISLVKHQDNNNLGWVRFFVALEGALFAALVFLNRYPTTNSTPVIEPVLALMSLPAFGILFSVLFERIMVRERRWHAWYVQQFRLHSPHGLAIFPHDDRPPKTRIDDLPSGRIAAHLTLAARGVVAIWLVVAVILIDGRWHVADLLFTSLLG